MTKNRSERRWAGSFRRPAWTWRRFRSGAAFLESLKNHSPDCVVLDLHMPLMNGFEVQARLAAPRGMPVPVVIITGHDSDETRERALATRPVAYLRKPVDDQTLLDAIELGLRSGPQAKIGT